MSRAPTPSVARLERLVAEVFRLRQIIAQSSADDRLAEEGVRVRHLVDVPMFNLYAEPDRNSGMVAAIPSLVSGANSPFEGDDDDAEEFSAPSQPRGLSANARTALYANALLTGEYLFKLRDAQDDEQVLVSPEHLGEVFGYVGSLQAKAQDYYRQSLDQFPDVYERARQRLVANQRLFQAERISSAQWIAAIREVVDGLAKAAKFDVLAPYRLRKAFESNRIADAGQDHDFSRFVAPSIAEVQDWKRKIYTAKSGNRVIANPHAVEADAVTLAQLAKANAMWRPEKRVFLLVTSDTGLQRAYARYVQEVRKSGRRAVYALRDPRQYVPLLNVRDMEGQYRQAAIFQKVRDAIEAFEASVSSSDFAQPDSSHGQGELFPDRAALHRVIGQKLNDPAFKLDPFVEQIEHQIAQIGDRWTEAIESSVVAKLDVIAELADQYTEVWAGAHGGRNLDRMFMGRVDEMRSGFESLATSTALLRQEIWAVESALQADDISDTHNRREIASHFRGFRSALFAGQSLREIAHSLLELRERLIPMLTQVDRDERLLFVGSLCLSIGAWAAARMLLQRAAKPTRANPLDREIHFFLCIARRLAASRLEYGREYSAVRKSLNGLGKTAAPGDALDHARIANELFAVELCEIVYRAGSPQATRTTLEAVKAWTRTREDFGAHLEGPSEDEDWDALSRKFLLNTCALMFWVSRVDIGPLPALEAATRSILDLLDSSAGGTLARGNHGAVYPQLARYALAASAEERRLAARAATNSIEVIQAIDATSGFAFDLPLVDRAEFDEVLRIFRADADLERSSAYD